MKDKTKNELDYLLIPTGWGRQRRKRALEEMKHRRIRKAFYLDGNNSEEDILYLGRIIKKGDKMGIVTFPLHYKEYLEIIKKAQKEKKFPKGVKIENIATRQSLKQFIYGILGLLEEGTKKEVHYTKEERGNKIISSIKGFIKSLLKN